MTAGKKGTSNLNTLTRSVAGLGHESPVVRREAIGVLLRAYEAEDHRSGRRCTTNGCATCGGPSSPDSGIEGDTK